MLPDFNDCLIHRITSFAMDPSELTDLPCSVPPGLFCSAVFGQASERADMSQSAVAVAGRVTVEELHSPFFSFFFPSSLHSVYAFMLMTNCLPSFLQLETPPRPSALPIPSTFALLLVEDETMLVDMGID